MNIQEIIDIIAMIILFISVIIMIKTCLHVTKISNILEYFISYYFYF